MDCSNDKVIYAGTLLDSSENAASVEVFVTQKVEKGSIEIALQFPRAGILRSRPALIASVDAALNAIWIDVYHNLFGAEAVPDMPLSLIEDSAVKEIKYGECL